MNFTIYRSFSSINNLKNIWMILYIVFDLLNWRECCQYFPFVRNRIIFTIFSKFQQIFSHFFIKKCFTLFSTFTWSALIKMRTVMTIISPIFFLSKHIYLSSTGSSSHVRSRPINFLIVPFGSSTMQSSEFSFASPRQYFHSSLIRVVHSSPNLYKL